MSITRRAFAGLVGAGGSARGFFEHKILRRPYAWRSQVIARPGYQWRGLRIHVTHTVPIRVSVSSPGKESLAEMTVRPTSLPGPYNIQSVVGLDAALGLVIAIESSKPFEFRGVEMHLMIHSERIKEWTRIHGESLGASSDMGNTWLIERIEPT